MKFTLLEIESTRKSVIRPPDFAEQHANSGTRISSLTIRLDGLKSLQHKDMFKAATMYADLFSLQQYDRDAMTVRIDLNRLNGDQVILPDSLAEFETYLKNLTSNLHTHQSGWHKKYGIQFNKPLIMGVLNVTPDSFSDGGLYKETDSAVRAALTMTEQGADLIDIGGESSRPGASPVDAATEIDRVVPVITNLRDKSDVLVSIDTYKAEVAEAALQAGANWINDISGLRMDNDMLRVARDRDVPVVVMHMQGTPSNMQADPQYENVTGDLLKFFEERISTLNKNGIDKIIIDPGIGFGKTLEHNMELLRHLPVFRQFGYPLLIGTSRKSFIGSLTGRPVHERLAGTLSSVVWSVLQGVSIVRVHDVAECVDTLRIINSIYKIVN